MMEVKVSLLTVEGVIETFDATFHNKYNLILPNKWSFDKTLDTLIFENSNRSA